MRKKIGVYQLGSFDFEVYVTSDSGGMFSSSHPDRPSMPFIEVGLDHERWSGCLEVLLHEAEEACAFSMGLIYVNQHQHTDCAANRVFHYDHAQFAEKCARVAKFLTWAQVAVAEQFWKEQKRRKQARKKAKAGAR